MDIAIVTIVADLVFKTVGSASLLAALIIMYRTFKPIVEKQDKQSEIILESLNSLKTSLEINAENTKLLNKNMEMQLRMQSAHNEELVRAHASVGSIESKVDILLQLRKVR